MILIARRTLLGWAGLALAWGMPLFAETPATSGTKTATDTKPPLKIAIIGDSTVCNYPIDKLDRGWGMFIEEAFAPGSVTVVNLAASGRSTKTFIKEGRWKKTLAEKPDFILIQFGHNDSHAAERPESTNAATDYREFLNQYIDEARAAGATPILVTPMVRRNFKADGKLNDILQPYADAMKAVGAEKKAPVIDLFTASKTLVENLGPEKAAAHANKPGDNTHFNETGARAMAELVLKELPATETRLKGLLNGK